MWRGCSPILVVVSVGVLCAGMVGSTVSARTVGVAPGPPSTRDQSRAYAADQLGKVADTLALWRRYVAVR